MGVVCIGQLQRLQIFPTHFRSALVLGETIAAGIGATVAAG
jgi:hypothetical protein